MYTEKQQDEIKRLRAENKDLAAKVVAMQAQLYPAGSQPSAPQMEHLVRTNLDGAALTTVRGDGWRVEMLQFVHSGDGVVQLCGVFVREKRVQPGPVVQPARASSVVVSSAAILTADEVALSMRKPAPALAALPEPEPAPAPEIDEDEAEAQEAAEMAERAEAAIFALSTWALGRLAEVVGQQTMDGGSRIDKATEYPLHKLLLERALIDADGIPTALAWAVCRRYARMQEEAQRVADEMPEDALRNLVLGIYDRRVDLTPEQFELSYLAQVGVTDTTRGGMHLSPFGNLVADILDARRKTTEKVAENPPVETSSAPPSVSETPQTTVIPAEVENAKQPPSDEFEEGAFVLTRRGRMGTVVGPIRPDRMVRVAMSTERLRTGQPVARWHYKQDVMRV